MSTTDPWANEPPVVEDAHTEGDAADAIERAFIPPGGARLETRDGDTGPVWRFKEARKGDDYDDPTEDEFFRDGSLTRALVRESIQNALDAELEPGVPVCVRFRLGASNRTALPAWLFDGLSDHLGASSGADEPAEKLCPWLLVEDFNTVGLTGDPYLDDPKWSDNPEEKNHYFYFWRNTGRTNKTSDERGSWGIGKAVYQSASRTRSFYGLTVRHDDGAVLLRGKSVLENHHIEGQRYFPRGHFGQFKEDPEEANFALPIVNATLLDEFCETFDSKRKGRSGLSVVVPWLDEGFDNWTVDDLALSVCEQYVVPITAGQLIVEVVDDERVISIDRESIAAVIHDELLRVDAQKRLELTDLIKFATWAIDLPRDRHLVLNRPPADKNTHWSDDLIPKDVLDKAREQFDSGKPLAIRCGVKASPKKGASEICWFSVYIQREDELPSAHVTFVKRGITIPEVSSQAPPGIRAMVIVNWPLLGKLLGDAENPAHTKWEPRKSRVNRRWLKAETTIRFVQRSVKEIISRIVSGAAEVDTEMFKDVFFFEKRREEIETKGKRKRKKTDRPIIKAKPKERVFSISSLDGGVSVRGESGLENGDLVTLRFAYGTRRGNPFKKWDERDFDLASMPYEARGAKTVTQAGQVIKLRVLEASEFTVHVRGFDTHRDLEVDARRVKEAS